MASRTSSSSRSPSASLLAALALASLATAPLFGAACGSTNAAAPGPGDAGSEASIATTDGGGDDAPYLIDAAIGARCTQANFEDPVGLCVQKQAILGEHAAFSTTSGMPTAWSVDTGLPATTDGGAVIHDVRDDVAYGASLAEFYASATAYGDPDQLTIVTTDLEAVAQLVESELATLPADYDGALYLRLRKLAGGLRLASFPTDANAIDALADKYGRAIYSSYFHAVTQGPPPDAGPDASGEDAGLEDASAEDASASDAGDSSTGDAAVGDAASDASADAGPSLEGDGILGTASGNAYAYDSAKAASGALALVDLAARASGFSPTPGDAGALDEADALAWSRAAAAVFNHLASRARDTSGLYFGELQTSDDAGHDAVTDDGSFSSQTQGAIALAFVRAAHLASLSGLDALPRSALAQGAADALDAAQSINPSLWDPLSNNLTLAACTQALPPISPCGGGYFAGIDATKKTLDVRKGISANAFLLAALHRASLVTTLPAIETGEVTPLGALFTLSGSAQFGQDGGHVAGGVVDAFFTQVPGQAGFVPYVTRTFALTENEDGGLPALDGSVLGGASAEPLARYYSTTVTADAIDGMNDQWIGLVGAPTLFQ